MNIETRNADEQKWLSDFINKHKNEGSALINREPTEDEIHNYMNINEENYYCSREKLRELSYGGKPPMGFRSWGDYHKNR